MKVTLLEIALYNKSKETIYEYFYGKNLDNIYKLLYEEQLLNYLRKSEVQSTEHKGVKNGQRTRNI